MTAFASGYFRFQAVGRYVAHAVGGGPALIRTMAVLPRIDDPITPKTSRWNR